MAERQPALLTWDEAKRELGVSKAAIATAIERGDLIEVEMEGVRGSTRKLITSASVNGWIARLNGETDPPVQANTATEPFEFRIAALRLNEIAKKVDASLSKFGSRQERDRRTRLRHTVSSRIGDAFDQHGFYVYILWGADEDNPLYIGQSRNVLSRLGQHMADKEKRYLVRSVQLIKCSGRATMCRTEPALIREYSPPLNTVGVQRQAVANA